MSVVGAMGLGSRLAQAQQDWRCGALTMMLNRVGGAVPAPRAVTSPYRPQPPSLTLLPVGADRFSAVIGGANFSGVVTRLKLNDKYVEPGKGLAWHH